MNIVIIFSVLICLAIFIVLVRGLLNMGGGNVSQGGVAGNASQKFMRWRVALQAFAIIVVLLLIYWQS